MIEVVAPGGKIENSTEVSGGVEVGVTRLIRENDATMRGVVVEIRKVPLRHKVVEEDGKNMMIKKSAKSKQLDSEKKTSIAHLVTANLHVHRLWNSKNVTSIMAITAIMTTEVTFRVDSMIETEIKIGINSINLIITIGIDSR